MATQGEGKEDEYEMYVDYTELNKILPDDPYPMPMVQYMFSKCHGMKWFSRIVLLKVKNCWNIPIDEELQKYTAFALPGGGCYVYTILPTNLKNSKQIAQKTMDQVFSKHIKDGSVLAYADDILVMSKDEVSHCKVLDEVLQIMNTHELKIDRNKCTFCQKTAFFLEYVITPNTIQADYEKILRIVFTIIPENREQLKSFLDTIDYYSNFLPDICVFTEKLLPLLQENTEYIWTMMHMDAIHEIKTRLRRIKPLAFPDLSKRYIVTTHANETTIGGSLTQLDENEQDESKKIKYIHHISLKLEDNQTHWSQVEKEMYAIVAVTEKLKHYIGKENTNHGASIKIDQFKCPDCSTNKKSDSCYVVRELENIDAERMNKWKQQLTQYDLQFESIQGTNQCMAKWISKALGLS